MERKVITAKELRAEKIDEKVLEELKKGKKKKDIVETLHITGETLNISIYRLIKDGRTTENDIKRYKKEVKKEELLKHLNEGMSKGQATRKIHIENSRVTEMVIELVEEGKIDKSFLDYGNGLREKNKNKVLEKLKLGYTISETAETLGMNKSVVYGYVRELVADGKIKREDITKKRRRKISNKEEYKIADDEKLEKEKNNFRQDSLSLSEKNENQQESCSKANMPEEQENKGKNSKNIKTSDSQNSRLSEEEKEAIVIDLIQNGWKNQEISKELEINFRNLRKIIDRAVMTGKLQFHSKKNSHCFKKTKTDVELKETSNIERWKTALQNIEKRLEKEPIQRVDKRLYFMYCRRLVKSGEELSSKELNQLVKTILCSKEDIEMEKVKFIGMQYLKLGNITPAIDMIDEWTKLYGEDEDLKKVKDIFKMFKYKQEVRKEKHDELNAKEGNKQQNETDKEIEEIEI